MITSLSQISEGVSCRIKWLLSPSDRLRTEADLSEDEILFVLQNLGDGNVIIRYLEHRYALSEDIAKRIKVEPI